MLDYLDEKINKKARLRELKEYNEKYAKATIEQLKKQYQLEQYDI